MMKALQKRPVAALIMVLAIAAGILLGQVRKPDESQAPSTAIVGTYTYVYDYAGVLSDETMAHIDAMNASLFAQTGAQLMVQTVSTTGGVDIVDYATDLGNQYGVGSRERNNGLVLVLALDDVSQSGLLGDYGVSGGDGLYDYGQELTSLLYAYMEEDFAAGTMTPPCARQRTPISNGLAISMASPSGKTTSPLFRRPTPPETATIPAAPGIGRLRPMWWRPGQW